MINPFLQSIGSSSQAILPPSFISRLLSPLVQEGGAVEIYGERGMGKSIVLRYLSDPPEEWKEYFRDHIFVFLNCQDSIIPPTSNKFWFEVTKQLCRRLEANPIQEKCFLLLDQFHEGQDISHNDFHEILDIASNSSKKIALVLDDFDVLIRTDPENLNNTRGFLQGLRSLTTRDSAKANLVVSTRYSLYESCKPLALPNYSAFDNGFVFCRLRFFGERELLAFLDKVVESGQPVFNSAERSYVAYLSGFHPQLAQIAASQIFDCRIETSVPLGDLSLVGERFKNESRPIFESLFWRATEIERFLLMLIALKSLQGKAGDISYDVADIEQVIGEREREINDLTERGLINRVRANPPQWCLFSPIFQWWILKEIESEDPSELEKRRKVWGNLLTQQRAEQAGKMVEFIKRNRETIETLGSSILRIAGWNIPEIPSS